MSANTKNGQVSILTRRLAELRPHPLNDKLYRPVVPADPDIQALADDIRKNGLLEPLIITRDNYILSGHRRRVACRLAGLRLVPCRVKDIQSDDPRCLDLLAGCNRQRVKSLDEVMREEVVSADPEEAHRLLVEHRRRAARVDVEVIEIEGLKWRSAISAAKEPFLAAVRGVLEERRDFWPLTLRQVHYALLNDPPLKHAGKAGSRYANDLRSYKSLSDLLTRARLAGMIPHEAIEDGTRPVTVWACHASPGPFIRAEVNHFLKGYYRDLQRTQPNHIEVLAEKNSVASILKPVVMEYCIPLTIGRGYSSLPPRKALAQRFRASGKEKLVLLVLSDFDPEGEDIAHSFARSMRDDFGIEGVVPVKVALTCRQVEELDLPPIMKAKQKSSRRKKFVAKHGDDVHELEAVAPDRLQAILRHAIDSVLDMGAFNAEVDLERQDAAHLAGVRRRLLQVLQESGELSP